MSTLLYQISEKKDTPFPYSFLENKINELFLTSEYFFLIF